MYMYTRATIHTRAYIFVFCVIVAMMATVTVAAQSVPVPAAPTGMQTVAGDTKVSLFWTDPGDGTITEYEYQQKEGSGSYGAWTAIADSSATTTHYTVTGLTNGTVYKYKIRAKAGSTDGAESSEVTVTPAADNVAPTLGTVTATGTDGTVVSAVRYLSTGDAVTLNIPVTDPNPPSTAPTVVVKFGATGTERTLTAGTRTLAYQSPSVVATFPYTYTLVNGDAGTLRYKVTDVDDTAATPNGMTDQATFTEITAVTAEDPVTGIGLQAGSDSGVADDDITNDTTAPVIAFTLTSGATVTARYQKSGGSWTAIQSGSISATGTDGTVTLPNLTDGDGDYEVEITQTESGQQSRAARYSFTLDTTAPTAPTAVTKTAPAVASGTDDTVTVSVTADDGATVRLYSNGTCTTRLGSNEETVPTAGAATGTVSLETGFLSPGAYTIYAGAVDDAGNVGCSTASAAYTRNTPPLTATPSTITEINLHGATVALTLNNAGETFAAGTPNTNHFTITPTGLTGLTVASAVRTSNTVVTLTLGYTGGDFDTAGSFIVTAKANAHSGSNPYTTDSISAVPNAADPPAAPGGVVATPDTAQVTLSWTASPSGENVTGYEYRRSVPTAYTPPSGSWVRNDYRTSAFRIPTITSRTTPQVFYYSMRQGGGSLAQAWIGPRKMYACEWTTAVQREKNDDDCTEVTIVSQYNINAEHTFRFTPTQMMIHNGGVVFLMTYLGGVRHTQWAAFSPQLAYGDWTAIPDGDITTTGGVKSYTVTGLTNDISYAFQVRAVNATGNGAASDEVTATPDLVFSISSPAADTALAETAANTLTVTVNSNRPLKVAGDVLCTLTPYTDGGRDGTEHADFYDTAASAAFTAAPTATASFGIGETSATCVFTVNNDTDYEPDEHFTVTLSSPGTGAVTGASYHATDGSRRFNIEPNDITVGMEETAVEATEISGSVPVCAAITTPADGTNLPTGVSITVTATTADGTAAAGTDYTALSDTSVGTLNNGTRRACVNISIANDAVADHGETFSVTLSATPARQMVISPATATVTIIETPAPPTGLLSAWKADSVALAWDDPGNISITGYEYRRCDGNGDNCTAWSAVTGSTATTTAHTVTGLSANTAYTFGLRAKNANGNSTAATTAGTTGNSYDTDADGLIEIDSLAKLNAVRWDINTNGVVSATDEGSAWTAGDDTKYAAVFSGPATDMGCPGVCTGYELTANLDFDTGTKGVRTDDTYHNSGAGWDSIDDFAGTFNGNGHIISNLFINQPSSNDHGLFGETDTGSNITGVGLHNPDVTGQHGVAPLIGIMRGGTATANFSLGGSVTGQWAVGGLVGNKEGGTVEASYSNTAVVSNANSVGGLVGNQSGGSSSTVKNSYAYGAVSGTNTHIGGLVGNNSGGAIITNSYWDNTVTSAGGTGTGGASGRSATALRTPTAYNGIYAAWDDSNIDGVSGNDSPWDFGTASQYPALSFGGHDVNTQRSVVNAIIATPGAASTTLTWTVGTHDWITGWEYSYKTESAGAWGVWTAVPSSTASTRTVTVPSLTNGTVYLFKVRPTAANISPPESAVAVATPNTGIAATNFDSDTDNLIEITTPAQLNAIRYDPDGDGMPDGTATIAQKKAYAAAFKTSRAGFLCAACEGYELMNSIDLDTDGDGSADSDDAYWNSGNGWESIDKFTATFNGNGFIIDNLFINMTADQTTSDDQGLFGRIITGAEIRSVGIRDADITGRHGVGTLVGIMDGGTVSTSYSTGTVTGKWSVGGLVGFNKGGTVEASYSGVTVTSNNTNIGGLVGFNQTSGATVKNSYAYGAVTGSTNDIGGLVGKNEGGTITDSYWDSTVTSSTGTGTGGAVGKTTAQLQSPTSYTSTAGNGATAIYDSWDDSDIDGDGTNDAPWDFGTATDYPTLNAFQTFTLDLDASGSYEPNRDAILLYLYTNQGSSASELTTFVDGGQQGTVANAITGINAVKDSTNTPMDMDGNGTFTPATDGAIPYLHSGQGYDATALVPFTHDRQQTTAANAITRVRGNLTPNWP